MKRVIGIIKRKISALVAIAMLITAMPQANMSVYAAEMGNIAEASLPADGDAPDDSEAAEETAGADGQEDSKEAGGEDNPGGLTEENGTEEDPPEDEAEAIMDEADETQRDSEAEAEIQESSDGTDSDDVSGDDGTGLEESDETKENGNLPVQAGQDESAAVLVRINIPRYSNSNTWSDDERYMKSFVSRLAYRVGGSEAWKWVTASDISLRQGYVDISAKAGESLQFRVWLTPNHAVLKEVSYVQSGEGTEKTGIDPIDGIYTLDSLRSDSAADGTEPAYTITISADFFYSIHFADAYAERNGGTRSVRFYQSIKDDAGSAEERKDMIGETVELYGAELKQFLDQYVYEVEVEQGYRLYDVDFNAGSMRVSDEDGVYTLSGSYNLGAKNITLYLFADPVTEHKLTVHVPAELQDRLALKISGKSPSGQKELELVDGSVSVKNDTAVTVEAWLENDPEHTLRAVCTEGDGEAVELSYNLREKMKDESGQTCAWRNRYELGSMLRDWDVTIDFSQIDMYSVNFHVNSEQVSEFEFEEINIYEPTVSSYNYENVSVDVAEGEQLAFEISVEKERLHVCTSTDGSGELEAERVSENGTIYRVTPLSSMELYVDVSAFEYQFDYLESDFSVILYNGEYGTPDEPLFFSENHIYKSAYARQFYVMVRPNNSKWKNIRIAYEGEHYNSEGEIVEEAERYSYYDRDGYMCYFTDDIRPEGNDNKVVFKIEGYDTHMVSVEKSNASLGIRRVQWNQWGNIIWGDRLDSDEYGNGYKVKDGEEVYFRVWGYDSKTQNINVSLSNTAARLESFQEEDDYGNLMTIYHFTAEADTTICIGTTARALHRVMIEKTENVTGFHIEGEYSQDATGAYLVWDGQTIRIEGISNNASGTLQAGYRDKVLCTAAGVETELPIIYGWRENDGELIYYNYYEIEVTDSMQINIDVVEDSLHKVTFADTDKLKKVTVWERGKSPSDNLYNEVTHSVELRDHKLYYLDVQMQDGYATAGVSMKEDTGKEMPLQAEDDMFRVYRLNVPQGDAVVAVNAVPGYTVKFLSEEDSVTFYEEETGRQNSITNVEVQQAAAQSFAFGVEKWQDQYIALDSEAFTVKKVWKKSGYDGEDLYQYVIAPAPSAVFPSVVTVTTRTYTGHEINLDYPEQIKEVRLEDADGNLFHITSGVSGKAATVYGDDIVLRVRDFRYEATVKRREADEEKILVPFRTDDRGYSDYFIGELDSDIDISITLARPTHKITHYEIEFQDDQRAVRVADAVTKARYLCTFRNEHNTYSIRKGTSVAFTVAAEIGYNVDGVYANGEALMPDRDGVYTVTPTKATLIKVETSMIEQEYPITFTYPDAVKAVTVKGYGLQEDVLRVKEGTDLNFAVELADQTQSVTSVKMNGRAVSHNRNDGSYTVTTLAEPMRVEIITAAVDKRVTFSRKAQHMIYSVVTDERVKESGTSGTYIVSPDAGEMHFTVFSPRKESIPCVTYVSTADGRNVLPYTGRQETDEGMSYTYAVKVSRLPVASDIIISETGAATEADRKRLEDSVNDYKDYGEQDYTAESWAAFAKALEEAQACLQDGEATTAGIDAAILALREAAAALIKKGDTPEPEPDPDPDAPEGLWIEKIADQTYTGAAMKPEIRVYYGETLLTPKKDYTAAYKNNTNAGEATVTVSGKGNFKGKATAAFTIHKKDIADEDIMTADVYAAVKANGTVANPKVTVKFGKKTLKANSDYKVEYPDFEKDGDGNIIAKDYKIKISTVDVKKDKKGNLLPSTNYKGEKTITYTVCANDIKLMSKAKISLTANSVDYADRMDAEKRPQIKSVKISGREIPLDDLTITEAGYEQAGRATITVEGKDKAKYYGSRSVTYTVTGTRLVAKELQIEGINTNGYDYTGEPIFINAEAEDPDMRTLKVTRAKTNGKPIEGGGALLEEGRDYTVSYKTGKKQGEHTNVGTVTVTITGIGAYTGSVNKNFKIKPVDLAAFGTQNAPAGLAFAAPKEAKYTKAGAKFEDEEITLEFNGVKLVEKQDYTVSYSGNSKVRAGEDPAVMIIKGKGNFKGQIKHKYEITPASERDVYATATDIVQPTKFTQLKTVVKVFETKTGKVLKAGADYDMKITYYSDEACTKPIVADNFRAETDVDTEVYAKIVMKGGYSGGSREAEGEESSGFVTARFRIYSVEQKLSDTRRVTVTVDTMVDKDGNAIVCDNTRAHNPYYTGRAVEPKVTVTYRRNVGEDSVTLVEGADYRVEYSNNINKSKKAVVNVIGIGNGYGGSRSVKFSIVPAEMSWANKAKETMKKAFKIFSEALFVDDTAVS